MIDFLIRKFIKDYENINRKSVRTSYGLLTSVVGIICNVILFVIKCIIGVMINSIAVIADAFNNLSDATSSIIGFVGTKLANRPPDKEHPFGHGRYEYVAALIVTFLVFQVGFSCMKTSITKIIHPETLQFQTYIVWILGISILIKLWLALVNRKLGKRINSSIMKATATDAFGDIGITSTTIISLLISKWFDFNIDGYVGVIVSLFVLISGVNILKDTIQPLLGVAVSIEDYERITYFVQQYEDVVGSHDLIVHNYGPLHVMASIHVEIPHTISIDRAHDIVDQIERDALEELDIQLVIHMDPVVVDDEEANKARETVLAVLKSIDKNGSIHDFRMVHGEETKKLIFDLVVPHDYSIKEENNLVERLRDELQREDAMYSCAITLEHSYIQNK